VVDDGAMKAYSEDLRKKVVQAVERRGTSKAEAARLFGISLSSVKRYTRDATRLGECYLSSSRASRDAKTRVAKTSAPYHLRDH
jgi:putative transposase